jgi:D-3-phosphoglycerate dehydrogenase
MELQGRTLGLLGTGAIGSRVAEIACAFGLRVIAHDPAPREELVRKCRVAYLPLDEVLAQSDIVSLHLPLTAATRGAFSFRQFSRMKPTAIFINTAREAIVDQAALGDALQSGKIAAAGLDDLDLSREDARAILQAENVVLTAAHQVQHGRAIVKKTEICIDNIEAFIAGRPQHAGGFRARPAALRHQD